MIKKNNIILSIFLSIAFSTFILYFSFQSHLSYQSERSYFYDVASYLSNNLFTYEKYSQDGFFSVLKNLLLNTWNGGFRYIIPFAFYPESLKSYNSYLYSTFISLFVFFSIFIYLSRKNGISLFKLLSICFCFLTLPVLYDPFYGLGAFWLDFTAGFSIAASYLLMFNIIQNSNNKFFFIAFILVFIVAAYSRFYTFIYFFFAFFPIIIFEFFYLRKYDKERMLILFRKLVIILILLITLLLPLLISGYTGFLNYTKLMYNLNNNLSAVLWFAFKQIVIHAFSYKLLIFCISFYLFSVYTTIVNHKENLRLEIYKLWIALSGFIFLIFIVKAKNTQHAYYLFLPVLFAFLILPLAKSNQLKLNKVFVFLLVPFMIYSAFQWKKYVYDGYIKNSIVTKDEKLQKQCDKQIASTLSELNTQKKKINFNCFFYEYKEIIMLELFYNHGVICEKDKNLYFSIWETYFKASYPKIQIEDIPSYISNNMINNLDVVIISNDPEKINKLFNNTTSYNTCKMVTEKVKSNVNKWKFIKNVLSPKYGELAIYCKNY